MKQCKNAMMKRAYERLKEYGYKMPITLNECYNSFSCNKYRAYDYCMDLYEKYNGVSFRIMGYNCMTFSVGFIGEIEDEKTGELRKAFFYITRDYDRYMFID